MGKTVDTRVTELQFDNKQFESGVKTSLGSIESLKKSLNFDQMTKSLSGLSAAGRNFSLQNISDNVENISSKFSIMGVVGATVIQNLTNKALDMVKSLGDMAFGISSIKAGFAEYEQGLTATQTILANTASSGATFDDVNKSMKDMNTYANQTVYSYGDMTTAMGTFTANGVKLGDSVQAIKGLYNVVSMTGGDANKAKGAVWQLSQAISAGALKLQDWNSVMTAGIAGPDFQNQLIQTAKTHGIAVDEMIAKAGSFRESLKEGWITSQVLIETLGQYGQAYTEEQLTSMGYTAEQIKQIQSLGQRAADSATKLKTFTQLVDMLKSNMVTGWAQSWKLVVGDLEEAKALWSEVGNFLGGVLQSSADARNNMLQTWKDLGGREALFQGIKNILSGLSGIVTAISDAFKEIFPPVTGSALAAITKGFQKLTSIFIMSSETANKLKTVFKGVFSIFAIAGSIIGTVVKGIGQLIKAVTPKMPQGGILTLLSNLALWVIYFKDLIVYGDLLGKTVRKIAAFFAPFVNALIALGTAIAKWITPYINNVITSFGKFNSLLAAGYTPAKALGEIMKMLLIPKLAPAIDVITSAIDAFAFGLGSLVQKFNFFIRLVKSGINPLDAFTHAFNINPKVADVLKAIGSAIWSFATGVKNALSGVPGALSNIGTGIKNAFSGIGKGVSDGMSSVNFDPGKILGDLAKKIKESFKNFNWKDVGSIFAGGLIGTIVLTIRNFIKTASGTFEGISGILEGVTGILDGVRGSLEAYQTTLKAKALMTIAIAIAILAASLIALSLVDPKKLGSALSAMTMMFAELMASMSVLSSKGSADMMKVATELLIISGAILILSIAIGAMAKIDTLKLAQGLLGVGIALKELSMFMKSMQYQFSHVSGFIGVAVALTILSVAVERFGKMDLLVLAKGLGSVGIALLELSYAVKIMGGADFGPKQAVGIAILAASLLILSKAVVAFGNIKMEVLKQGLISVGVVLAELAAFTKLTSGGNKMLSTSIAMTIMAGALMLFIKAISTLGNMSLANLVQGIVALAATLGILAVSVNAMNGSLSGAAALVILAVALGMIVPAILLLSKVPLAGIGVALLAIAGVFVILGLTALVLGPLTPVLMALGAAIILFGLAGLAAGVGLLALSVGLSTLVALGATAISSVGASLAAIASALAQAIVSFVQALANAAPQVADALGTILLALIDKLVSMTPDVVQKLLDLVLELLRTLKDSLPDILQAGIDLLMELLKGISQNIEDIVDVVGDIITKFLDAVSAKLGDIIDAGFNVIVSFINGLADAVENRGPEIVAAVGKLAGAIIKGLTDGIMAGIKGIVDAISNLAGAAIDALKVVLGIFSPSRVFRGLGEKTTEGFAIGLGRNTSGVKMAADKVGRRAVSAMSAAISTVIDTMNNDMDMNPTIRPVVDLAEVISGGKKIDNILGGRSINVGSVMSQVSRVSAGGIPGYNEESSKTNSPSGGSSIEFNQYNYSPTALSRIDIYRQTKNQLFGMKGLVLKA